MSFTFVMAKTYAADQHHGGLVPPYGTLDVDLAGTRHPGGVSDDAAPARPETMRELTGHCAHNSIAAAAAAKVLQRRSLPSTRGCRGQFLHRVQSWYGRPEEGVVERAGVQRELV